jgi:hypothetical protein
MMIAQPDRVVAVEEGGGQQSRVLATLVGWCCWHGFALSTRSQFAHLFLAVAPFTLASVCRA